MYYPQVGWARVTMGKHTHSQYGPCWEGQFVDSHHKVTVVSAGYARQQDRHGEFYDAAGIEPHRGNFAVVREVDGFVGRGWSLAALTNLFAVTEPASTHTADSGEVVKIGDMLRLPVGRIHVHRAHLAVRQWLDMHRAAGYQVDPAWGDQVVVQRPMTRLVFAEGSSIYEGECLDAVLARVVSPLVVKWQSDEKARVASGLRELASMANTGRLSLRWLPKRAAQPA
jgi:hypothetical protein